MINNVTLVGRLTKDVELRYTQSGIAVASFTVAVNRNFKNNQGNQEADFINCVIWRKAAETMASMTKKGSLIGITGRIQTGSYQNNEGRTVYTTEVYADNFQMLEPKSVTDQRRSEDSSNGSYNNFTSNNQANNQAFDNFDPNNSSQSTNSFNQSNEGPSKFDENPFEDSDEIDISDDDLPF